MATRKDGLRLAIALSIIVGISLTAQYWMSMSDYLGSIVPIDTTRVILNVLFWGAFALMVHCIWSYKKLVVSKKAPMDLKVLASLGLVVAIAHVGQFALVGMDYLKTRGIEAWLPYAVQQIVLISIFLAAVVFVFTGIYLYRQI